jgi:TetR/AcrR family transcriptional repressor of nem operon
MTSRKLATAPMRERILQEAEQLMLLHGFNGTSIDAICARAELTKGGFFHHFSSKEDLGSQLLHRYWEETVQSLLSSKYMKQKDPLKRLLGMVTFFESIFEIPERPSACLLGNLTQEVALTNNHIKSTFREIFEQWIGALSDAIKEVIKQRNIKEKIDVRGLAELIVAAVEGAFTMVKASEDLSTSKRSLKHLRNYLILLLS